MDGWLFFDHHRRDPLGYRVLQFTPGSPVTRRWFYFVPATGEPYGLVHKIEEHTLADLPGARKTYTSWSSLVDGLRLIVGSARRIAMQYSQNCSVPYVSLVDGGTLELIRSLGLEVSTSADLVQTFESRWSPEQLDMHLEAARKVDEVRRQAFSQISERLRIKERITEFAVCEFIRSRFAAEGLIADHGPDCAVNANASNPHYEPSKDQCAEIKIGDTVLIDLWAKLNRPNSVYYDICWVGYCGQAPPDRYQNVFEIVRDARNLAVQRVIDGVRNRQDLRGYQVDDAARGHITGHGLADYFYHRTGHSIGEEVHGTGANMDYLETHDERKVIPWTCFSVEPGVYLPEFGIRCEVDVFVSEDGARVTGESQEKLVLL